MSDSEMSPASKTSDVHRLVMRKAFICVHCEGVYADMPVTNCDCMAGTGADFIEGEIKYIISAPEIPYPECCKLCNVTAGCDGGCIDA